MYFSSVKRSLARIEELKHLAVHPAKYQSYVKGWARWWHRIIKVSEYQVLSKWVDETQSLRQEDVWIGSGLIAFTPMLLTKKYSGR